jgi:hypothetical protein
MRYFLFDHEKKTITAGEAEHLPAATDIFWFDSDLGTWRCDMFPGWTYAAIKNYRNMLKKRGYIEIQKG